MSGSIDPGIRRAADLDYPSGAPDGDDAAVDTPPTGASRPIPRLARLGIIPSVTTRRRWVWISLALGAVGVIAIVVAAALHWLATPGLNSRASWTWTERVSWFAGIGSLLVASASLAADHNQKRHSRDVRGGHSGPVGVAHGATPGTSTIEVPVGRLNVVVHGRGTLVKSLTRLLLIRRTKRPRVHVLHGLGGCGKTTVALVVADWAMRRGTVVWWVSAATVTDLHTGMRHVASRLGAQDDEIDRAWSGVDSATDLLWRLLNQFPNRWLLVVDNADDPESLAGSGAVLADGTGWLRPPTSRQGSVIVTSREGNPDEWGTWCRLHRVTPLSAEDGAQILLDHAGQRAGSADEAKVLAGRLGGLPLALRLAGAHVAEATAIPWPTPTATFAGYRAALDGGMFNELFKVAAITGLNSERSRAVVGRTWELSLDVLDHRGLTQARPLLRLLSYFADAPLPYQMVVSPQILADVETFAKLDAQRLWGLLQALAHLGLIDLEDTSPTSPDGSPGASRPRTLRIHPLVRYASRYQGEITRQEATYLVVAAKLLHGATVHEGYQSAEDPGDWPFWQAFAPHTLHVVSAIKGLPDLTAETAEHAAFAAQLTGLYLRARGLYAQCATCHQSIIDSCRPILGDRHVSIMAARHSLAALTHARGQFDDAEAAYRAVLDDRRAVHGEDHRLTLATRHQLANLLYDRGHFDEAESEWQSVLAANETARGKDHMVTINSRFMLARRVHSRVAS